MALLLWGFRVAARTADEGCRADHMSSHRDIIHVLIPLIRMRVPKVLVVAATSLIGFSREWRGIALHLGDKSPCPDPDRLVESSVCSSYQ